MKKPKKQAKFTCAAHWDIRPEFWLGRGWKSSHQIGRCRFWNPRGGDHHTETGKCTKHPEVRCPYRGWRDFTALQEGLEKKRNRQYANPIYKEEGEEVLV